ncbi:polymorphic toxin type 43 domain-containing protein [Actinoallomurus purpureus]|uniref:RHS repeat-associated core domain-containing protein n=1 Tax=Actinoallomurus purpureus TaxID=478114 RepID=UPI002093E3DB|nr:RHS repeat-associated core domain-containing protein [Actinoallomurus purpureus]MCO6007030.1 polymorphic toxin type 43 domain-containing protein [Actinoallomurus purpureus]
MRGGWIRQGWVAQVRRSRLAIGLIAVALLATLVPAVYLAVSGQDAPAVPKTQAVHGVRTFKPKKPVRSKNAAARPYRPGKVAWPSAGSGQAALDTRRATRVEGTPISVRALPPAKGAYHGPSSVSVNVASHEAAVNAGVNGLLFTAAARGGSGQAAGQVEVGVDYRAFAHAYGGNFGSRLGLVSLPDCALTSPQDPVCRTRTPLRSGNDPQAGTVYAAMSASMARPMVLAATTSGSGEGDGGGPAGSYQATELKASGSWSAGGSNGSFTYDYPIALPPAASALAPKLDLAYDSGGLDGQTAATQTQAGWAGDGWSTPRSFIERSFAQCSDSPEGSASPKSTSDQCWDGEILTLSLNGSSTQLVYDASKKTFEPADGNGDAVTHVTNSGNGSGTYNTDYWKVTDRKGTEFYFGRNQLPGWTSGAATTNSVDSEPVFSAHSGDPCYDAAGFSSSVCTMAYRWNLDYVKDVHSNAMAYYYKQDTNAYAKNTETTKATGYVRDSHLDHIDYGFTDGNAYTVNGGHAPDQVFFTTGDRCLSGTCDPLNKTNAVNWPDVPYDLNCTAGSSCQVVAPSHWSTVRLTGIKTQQWNGSAYSPVDSWALDETLPATGDGTSPTLWLSKITHTGSDTSAGGSAVTLPSVTFTPKDLQNRVATHDGLPILTRKRIESVTTETGEVIGVSYEQVDACSWPVSTTPSANTSSCYPVYWTPNGYSKPILDWFNKWQVASVTDADPTGGNPTMFTSYKYLHGGAWHYDDNEVVKAKYRTYGQWRGFGDVQTFTGQGNDAQTESETTYYRGMSQDNDTTKVPLTDSQGSTHDDTDQLAGSVLESTSYDYAGGPATKSTITSYWVSPPTVSRSRTGLQPLTANASGPVETWTRELVTSSGSAVWRKTETDTSYDTDTSSATFGLPLVSLTHGDLSDTSQQSCTVTTYAPANTDKNLVGLPAEVETDAASCGGANPGGASAPSAAQINALTAPTSVTRPDDVVSDQRAFYDDPPQKSTWPQPSNPAWPQAAPTEGNVSETQVAAGYSNGAFQYLVNSASVYDAYGRTVDAYDPLGNKTHVDYTMANGLTTATKTTNPLNQASTQSLDPLRGLATSATDANGITTTTHYDGLGRTIAVWGYSRATTSPANAKFTYQISASAPSVVTTQTMNDAQGSVTSSTTLYDALLRTRQVQKLTPRGGRLVTDTFYDTRGWAWKTNTDWYDSSGTPGNALLTVPDSQVPNQSVTAFDGLDRPVLGTSYEDSNIKSQTATSYLGDKTITVPLNASGSPFPGATAKATVTDALGRTTELDSYTQPPTVAVSTSGTPPITKVTISGGTSQATQYKFDHVGHQTDVKDVTTGEDWNSGYNLLGQVTSKKDPDTGTSTMVYDDAGNLAQTTDTRNKTISFAYDPLNRKTGEYDAPVSGQSTSNRLASWVYDNSDNALPGMKNPVGQLTTATAYVDGNPYKTQAAGFNAYGESAGETITIPDSEGALAGPYTFTHLYTSGTALPDSDRYPASPGSGSLPAETVTHGYSGAMDVLVTMGGLAAYTANLTVTPYGQVAQAELGSHQANHAYINNTFDPHTGALTDSQLAKTADPSTRIDETSYTYDPTGNPLAQTETRQGGAAETQCFRYDALDRLTQAWTGTDNCAADPSDNGGGTVGSGITGGAYWTTWTLDPLGQRTKQTRHGLNGAGDTVTAYDYNTGQPNTLASTSTTGPGGSAATSYGYDPAGNTTTRTTPANGQETLTWDDTGQLTAVTGTSGGSGYIYDADGQLLLQKDPGKTTLYLPNEEIALDTTTGAITGTRFYSLPGGGEAVRTGSGTAYGFELGDQHGTANLSLDATLTTPTWRQQDPYGDTRGTPPSSWPDNHGFLNKPQDTTTGLTDIGARWYDPSTSRFASIDPVFNPASPQEQNGYTYAASNPVTSSDPTGLMVPCSTGAGGCGKTGYMGGSPTPSSYCDTHDCQGPPSYQGSGGGRGGGGGSGGGGGGGSHGCGVWCGVKRFVQKHHTIVATVVTVAYEVGCNAAADAETAGTGALFCAGTGGAVYGWFNNQLDPNADHSLAATVKSMAINAAVSVATAGVLEAGSALAAPIGGAVARAAAKPAARAAARAAEDAAPSAGRRAASQGGRDLAGACNSFAAATLVLMADGTSKPIAQVKVGDKIADAAPGTDAGTRDQAHTVTDVHVTYDDHDYTDVTIATGNGPRTITGTSHHLYWDITTRAWTPADHLHSGDHLQTADGKRATILELRAYTAAMVTYNLTIDHLHTYYVEAGTTPVLVHNCGPNGVIQLRDGVKSTGALSNFNAKAIDDAKNAGVRGSDYQTGGRDFIFDPANGIFAVSGKRYTLGHPGLVSATGADDGSVVGGELVRGPDGTFLTDERSGHYGQQWNDDTRQSFEHFMSDYGFAVDHFPGWGRFH